MTLEMHFRNSDKYFLIYVLLVTNLISYLFQTLNLTIFLNLHYVIYPNATLFAYYNRKSNLTDVSNSSNEMRK